MDHHMHNPPLHWGYSGTPPNHHNTSAWVPPQTVSRGVKRSISESDCDDVYSETSSKDQTSPKDNDTDSCQHLSRKKRRGVIEKKRRDRINSSLSELKRLVPSAYEKQGSAKLEKAEILQLTVDHLKTLHAKGVDSLAYDPQRFAMDYHIIGFRECASEVARYLINIEGMDIQDPLRMRLMSHLQCFVAQREISAKSSTVVPNSSANWSSSSAYQTNYPTTYQQNYPSHTTPSAAGGYVPNLSSPLPVVPTPALHHHSTAHTTTSPNSTAVRQQTTLLPDHTQQQQQTQSQQPDQQQQQQQQHHHQQQQHQEQQQQHHYSNTIDGQHPDHQPTYTDLSSSNIQRNAAASIGYGNPHYPSTGAQGYGNQAYNANNGSKPYRPWGAEMAY